MIRRNCIFRRMELLPLHKYPEYLSQCCSLINEEWKRSDTARLRSLEASCDNLPTCLVLINNNRVIGHCKLTSVPNTPEACFIESVVIAKNLRGKGYGKQLMLQAEEYCKTKLDLTNIYLSTHDKEGFYQKLGYKKCGPITIYGNFKPVKLPIPDHVKDSIQPRPVVPEPSEPVVPAFSISACRPKIYMIKDLTQTEIKLK